MGDDSIYQMELEQFGRFVTKAAHITALMHLQVDREST